MTFNFNQNQSNNPNIPTKPLYPEISSQQKTDVRFQLMQGEKVLPADRDELSDRMSDLRLSRNLNQNQNQYFKPFNPNLIGVEAQLNRSHAGKKNEYKDIINNRMSSCHNVQLIQSQPEHSIKNNELVNNNNHPNFKDDRVFNNNRYQTNKVNNRQKNNDRLTQFMPLGNNCNFPSTQNTNPMGINSNSYFDADGNFKMPNHKVNVTTQQTKQPSEERYKQTNQIMTNNINENNMYVNSVQNNPQQQNYNIHNQQNHHIMNQNNRNPNIQTEFNNNIMTIGRLPESNQNSRVNFKDKANQRLQNLISLPKTSSIPFVQTYSDNAPNPSQKNVWKNNQQNIKNMKKRINELQQNCSVVINNMMPVDTRQIDFD